MSELDAARKVNEIYEDHIDRLRRELAEAEARGYRRGVQDAAKAMQPMIRSMISRDAAARAILALLEQAEPSLSPEDKPA